MQWPNDNSVITRLKVRGSGCDVLTTQMHAARLLNGISFHPASLPADAILCIRSLRDPSPGSLRLQSRDLHPSLEWERAVLGSIEQLARGAARPIDGAVPARAKAVIFRDRSEFLACLAADWCAGDLTTHWWWEGLLRGQDISRAVIAAWLETPEHIPLALHWLETKRLSVDFLQKLTADDSHHLMAILVQTFGLYHLLHIMDHVTADNSALPADIKMSNASQTTSNESVTGRVTYSPWQRWVQSSTVNQLPPERQLILGVGLMLHHVPSIVRTASFAKQVNDWQISFIALRSPESARDVPISVKPIEKSSAKPMSNDALHNSKALSDITDVVLDPQQLPRQDVRIKFSEGSAVITSPLSSNENTPTAITEDSKPASETTASQHQINDEIGEGFFEIVETEIFSQFGGICYFINLGLFLNLYGDFTTPLQPGIDLPIWDFVALVAQQILGNEVIDDPIWNLLAKLANRAENESPGLNFDPPRHVSLQVWLEELMLTIRPRLQLALAVNEADIAGLFRLPTRIVASETRLDVNFKLADLSIEIRLSGLDRDPGWVPAAGRCIRFIYE